MERTAAIIGAGLIGRAWAMVFARAGWRVRLYDNVPAQLDLARAHIAASLDEQQSAGLVDDAKQAIARIAMTPRIEDALAGVDWVQENLPEVLDIKRESLSRAGCAGAAQGSAWRVQRQRFLHRSSPRLSPGARAAWSRIRSIRRTSFRWSNCAARRGPVLRPSNARRR